MTFGKFVLNAIVAVAVALVLFPFAIWWEVSKR